MVYFKHFFFVGGPPPEWVHLFLPAASQVAGCRAEDVDQAVNAAAEAQVEWAALTGKARGQVLRKFFDLMVSPSKTLRPHGESPRGYLRLDDELSSFRVTQYEFKREWSMMPNLSEIKILFW